MSGLATGSAARVEGRMARSRSTEIYAELRRGLLRGEYPLIERLAELRLAEQFSASRTPIREALLRLESEGLVQRRPEGGFYPRSPNLPGIRDLYELRRIIELASLLRPREHGSVHSPTMLAELQAQWELIVADPPEPDPDFVLVDERFHVGLAEAAGNLAVAEHLQAINERIRVVRMQNSIDAERIHLSASQHLAIVRALLEDRPHRAVELMTSHLDDALGHASLGAAAALERMMTAGALVTQAQAANARGESGR